MSENNNKPVCDFDFIAQALGLLPYRALAVDDNTTIQGAFNLGAIINLEVTDDGGAAFTLHGGEEILMSADHLAAFENALREKVKENQARQREAMLAMQGVQPGSIIGVPTGRKFRQ